jgi:hypothetical protein
MSTEYTIVRTCQVSGDRSSLPLGLSVGARRFQFRAHPSLNLVSFESIVDFIKRDGAEVVDEYDRVMPLDDFVNYVRSKLASPDNSLRRHERDDIRFDSEDDEQRNWVDAQGHSFANYDFF